ncbi:MAG: hypothetical protein ACKO9Q_05405, partial [Pirellula sp.]
CLYDKSDRPQPNIALHPSAKSNRQPQTWKWALGSCWRIGKLVRIIKVSDSWDDRQQRSRLL